MPNRTRGAPTKKLVCILSFGIGFQNAANNACANILNQLAVQTSSEASADFLRRCRENLGAEH